MGSLWSDVSIENNLADNPLTKDIFIDYIPFFVLFTFVLNAVTILVSFSWFNAYYFKCMTCCKWI